MKITASTTTLLTRVLLSLFLSLFLSLVLSRGAFAQAPTESANTVLDGKVRAAIRDFKGQVSIYAKNLDTGATYGLSPDQQVRTASTIKLPIMIETFTQVEAGRIKWTDELILTNEKKVSGSGILGEFAGGLRLTLRDALHLMIVLSDNTATNLILDIISADAVNARMEALGLKGTKSMRKVGGGGDSKAGLIAENKRFGLGSSTPREMVSLLERLERGELVTPAASKEMIAILKREQNRTGIGRSLKGVEVAHKPGALDALRSDVGIIYSPRGKIAMAITCDGMPEPNWTPDNPGLLMITRLSEIIFEEMASKK